MNLNDNLAYQEKFQERIERIDGKVVMMSPASTNHNMIADNIHLIFGAYLKGKKCVPFGDGEAVYLTRKDVFIPDFMVVCDPKKIKSNGVHGAPDLVVEVLSPGTMKNDRGRKFKIYARCGVREYWIIDPANKTIEQYLPADGTLALSEVYILHPDDADDDTVEFMPEEEKPAPVTEFRCSLFDDLTIRLEDVFDRID